MTDSCPLPPFSSLKRKRSKPRGSMSVGGIGQRKSHKSKMFRDGRIVLSPSDWKKLKVWLWNALTQIHGVKFCHICGFPIWLFDQYEPDHITPRGLGGGTRDDRYIKPSHSWCNREKGSQRNYACPKKEANHAQ